MDDKDQKIEEQGRKIDELSQQLATLTTQVQELLRSYTNHKHEGPQNDGSLLLQRSIDLIAGQTVGAGGVAGMTGITDVRTVNGRIISDRTVTLIGSGRDSNASDGLNNSQLQLEHQYNTDATSKQTFFYGLRSPFYVGAGDVTSGGTTMRQTTFKWKTNELSNAYIAINSPDGSSFSGFQIASNTEDTLTITGGTWAFSGQNIGFTIFMPIYSGSATYPWRRLYTGDTSGGGIRFGYGNTGGGQNGLLYSDGQNLHYRRPNGTIETLA